MEGVAKTKCAACGVMFMSETGGNKCPSCASMGGHGHGHEHGEMGGCGCGHSH